MKDSSWTSIVEKKWNPQFLMFIISWFHLCCITYCAGHNSHDRVCVFLLWHLFRTYLEVFKIMSALPTPTISVKESTNIRSSQQVPLHEGNEEKKNSWHSITYIKWGKIWDQKLVCISCRLQPKCEHPGPVCPTKQQFPHKYKALNRHDIKH